MSSSHSSTLSLQICARPVDAIAATWRRRLPQKLHRSARSASLACRMVAMGVLVALPAADKTVCTRLMHSLQMCSLGPADQFLEQLLVLPAERARLWFARTRVRWSPSLMTAMVIHLVVARGRHRH